MPALGAAARRRPRRTAALIALALLLGESTVGATLVERADSIEIVETPPGPIAIAPGTLALVDGAPTLLGLPSRGGAARAGALIAVALLAIPISALGVGALGAWLRPALYRLQWCEPAGSTLAPSARVFGAVFFSWAASGALRLGGALTGALPGVVFLVAGHDVHHDTALGLGLLAAACGAALGWLYVRVGLLFADRLAVREELAAHVALMRAWRTADRARDGRAWATYAALDLVGSLAWILGPLGALIHAPIRAHAESLLTRAFVEAHPVGARAR